MPNLSSIRTNRKDLKPTLRHKLLRSVLGPLVLTWALGSVIVIGFAYYFTTQAYDRSLLDDAHALSAQVRADPVSGLSLSLTDAEMRAVLFDQSESNYFSLWRADGRLLAGHAALLPQPMHSLQQGRMGDGANSPVWVNSTYQGRAVRAVSLIKTINGQTFMVVAAQTTDSRNRLLSRLLLAALVPQVLLLLLLAWWLRRSVALDLEPLSTMRAALEERDLTDLTPIPAALVAQAKTTDVEHLSAAINALFERVRQGVAAQREFSGNVAHELRTPLSVIRLQAEHVLTQTASIELRKDIKQLLLSADRASHLIDQLLALAFADEAKQSIALQRVDAVQVVRDAVLRHLARADQLHVDLGAEGLESTEPLWVLANPALLDAGLDNLLDNALRYGASAPTPKITVSALLENTASPPAICLRVIDNGRGLTQQEALEYKGRWRQAAKHRRGAQINPGVGLGLAIVVRYADLMGAAFDLTKAQPEHPQYPGLCASLRFAAQS